MISAEFKRNARGYFEYVIIMSNAIDPKERKDALVISSEFDKLIQQEILKAMKFKEENKKAKKAVKK